MYRWFCNSIILCLHNDILNDKWGKFSNDLCEVYQVMFTNSTLISILHHINSQLIFLLGLFYFLGLPCQNESLVEGLKTYVEKTSFAAGCVDVSCPSDTGFDEAVSIAKKADTVVVVAGLDLSQETEDRDRDSLLLPGKQMSLVSSVASAIQKPLILVLTGGGPLDVSFAEEDPRIASILWIGYPGEAGAKALAQIIFGDYNPGWYTKTLFWACLDCMKIKPF